jgi:pseudaminic acid synthase
MKEFKIGNRKVGGDEPTYIIAEMSANHLQDYDKAVQIIKQAKKAGADAIKLQTYTPDTITMNVKNEYFKIKQGTIWDGKTLYDLYKEAYTPWEWQPKLQKIAHEEGIEFFSTPFDKTSVDFLEEMKVPVYKIASFEINDIPLIDYIAKKGKPIIFSNGVAEISDIELAIKTMKKNKVEEIALLKCTSSYPAPIEQANLKTIPNMRDTFDIVSGLSDHTPGIVTPITAVALGAKIIEKHICLYRSLGGPDSSFSLEPEEFKKMVDSVRDAEKAIGKVNYELYEKQEKSRELMRSLFVNEDIRKGDKITEKNIRSVRPAFGLHPKYYESIVGKIAKKDMKKGEPLKIHYIEDIEI